MRDFRPLRALREFLALESAGGILLAAAAALAMLFANSPLAHLYDGFLDLRIEVRVGALEIAKPLLLWVNDGALPRFLGRIVTREDGSRPRARSRRR